MRYGFLTVLGLGLLMVALPGCGAAGRNVCAQAADVFNTCGMGTSVLTDAPDSLCTAVSACSSQCTLDHELIYCDIMTGTATTADAAPYHTCANACFQ